MNTCVNDLNEWNSSRGIGGLPVVVNNPVMELRIGDLLKERKISQTQMAHDLGVKQSTVSKWVSGDNSPPTKKLEEIAAYFNIDPLLLFRKYAENTRQLEIFLRLQSLDQRDVQTVSTLVESLSTPLDSQVQQ